MFGLGVPPSSARRPAWMEDAACIEHPEVEFIPPARSSEDHARAAKAICSRCLCRDECLAYALADPTLLGVWGGTSTAERREMRRRRAACATSLQSTPSVRHLLRVGTA